MAESRFNGKTGETVRWLLGLVLAAVVAYFTSIGAIESRVSVVETNEIRHFEELLRSQDEIRSDIRELRREIRGR